MPEQTKRLQKVIVLILKMNDKIEAEATIGTKLKFIKMFIYHNSDRLPAVSTVYGTRLLLTLLLNEEHIFQRIHSRRLQQIKNLCRRRKLFVFLFHQTNFSWKIKTLSKSNCS